MRCSCCHPHAMPRAAAAASSPGGEPAQEAGKQLQHGTKEKGKGIVSVTMRPGLWSSAAWHILSRHQCWMHRQGAAFGSSASTGWPARRQPAGLLTAMGSLFSHWYEACRIGQHQHASSRVLIGVPQCVSTRRRCRGCATHSKPVRQWRSLCLIQKAFQAGKAYCGAHNAWRCQGMCSSTHRHAHGGAGLHADAAGAGSRQAGAGQACSRGNEERPSLFRHGAVLLAVWICYVSGSADCTA